MNSLIGEEFPKRFLRIRDKYHKQGFEYENSKGYLLQATRAGPSVEYIEDDTAIVCTTKGKGLNINSYSVEVNSRFYNFDHPIVPPEDGQYIIVASAGLDSAHRVKMMTKVARQLAQKTGNDVIVKNVGRDIEDLLKQEGFEDYNKNERWDAYAKYDDNTYPQPVINVRECSRLEGSKYSRLRYELSRFNKKHPIRLHPYGKEFALNPFNKLIDLVNLWADQMSRKTGLAKEHFKDSHMNLIYEEHGYCAYDQGKMIGFMQFDKISNECLAMTALITDFNYTDLCRKMMFEGVRHANETGYAYLNIGGSETEGQHKSKMVFRPEITIQKKHLAWRHD